jgi:hypothetical protein
MPHRPRITLGFMLVGFWFTQATVSHAQKAPSEAWKRHIIDNTSLGADGVRTADVNQDGLPDLVAGWEQGGVSRIYLMQREDGERPSWVTIDAGPAPNVEDALLVDLDQDGSVDVVSSTEGNNKKLLIHWAPAPTEDYTDSALWTTETLFENEARWMFAIAMDIDGLNGPDLVVGGKNPLASVGWLESPQDPRTLSDWKFHPLSDAAWIMSLIPKDMDDDGLLDILVSERKAEVAGVYWLRNPGKESFQLRSPWQKTWIADHLTETMFIDTYDLDGDAVEEIIVPHKNPDEGFISIFSSKDRIYWNEIAINYPDFISHPKSAQFGDINQDGKTDMVLSTEGADQGRSGIIWLEYPNSWDDPNWIAHDVSGPDGIKFDLNLLLDLDADGDLDIINTEENNNAKGGKAGLGIIWYENPTINRSH